MFEYYLLVTYVDGTVLDIPAGKTAFIPASSVVGAPGEGRTEGLEVVMVDSKRDQRPGQQGPPECVSPFVGPRMGLLLRSCRTEGWFLGSQSPSTSRRTPPSSLVSLIPS